MNGVFKIFVFSLFFYLCVASPSFSADTAEQNKETVVKAASDENTEAVKGGADQNNSAVKASSEQKTGAVATSSEQNKNGAKFASVFFPAPTFEFDSAVDGTDVIHDFVIMNKGTDILKVEKVKTG